MSYVVYDSGVELALYLVPQAVARRQQPSRLLFDRVGVPPVALPPPESPAERREAATAGVAFFWMMAGIAARYRLRGWHWPVNRVLEQLRAHLDEVQRLLAGAPPGYRPRPPAPLASTPQAQAAAIRELCDAMEALMPAVVRFGGAPPPADPRAAVEARLVAPPAGQTSDEARVAGALAHLAAHLPERLTVAGLAAAAGLSRAHFSVVFARATGLPPRRYLQRSRLLRARELLATGDLPVAAVARAVGFRDAAHFHRVFVREEGLTPDRYRAHVREPRER
jgi:AraC-like DNA-binding protein